MHKPRETLHAVFCIEKTAFMRRTGCRPANMPDVSFPIFPRLTAYNYLKGEFEMSVAAIAATGYLSAFSGIMAGFAIIVASKKMGRRFEAVLTGFTAGLLLAFICFRILAEGFAAAPAYAGTAGLLAGAVFAAVLERTDVPFGGASAVMLHHFTEGIALGGMCAVSAQAGLALAAIIAFHCIPEAAAVFMPAKRINITGVLLCVLIALPMAAGSVLGAALSGVTGIFLCLSLTFAGGVMLYVACGEMLPESTRLWSGRLTAVSALAGFILGVAITI